MSDNKKIAKPQRAKSKDLDDEGKARLYEYYEYLTGISIIDYLCDNAKFIPYEESEFSSKNKDINNG